VPNFINKLVVEEMRREFKEAAGMVVVTYGGVNTKENESLRNQLAAKGVKFALIRNSLAQHALKERGLEFPEGSFSGVTAIAYGTAEAAIHTAKILGDAEIKKAGKITIRVGMLEGKVLGPKDTEALANVPDRRTLNGKLVSLLSAPGRGLVTVLNANNSAVARVLQARADALGGSSEKPAEG
jgi:large subunit ribosomal protein L10